VDLAVRVGGLQPASACVTCNMLLAGAAGWHAGLFAELAQAAADLLRPGVLGVSSAKHLAHAYGDRARAVLQARCSLLERSRAAA
jgi:hypothetical protein